MCIGAPDRFHKSLCSFVGAENNVVLLHPRLLIDLAVFGRFRVSAQHAALGAVNGRNFAFSGIDELLDDGFPISL